MATLAHKGSVIELLAKLEALPRNRREIAEIWEYLHRPTNRIHWAVFTKSQFNDLNGNPFVGPRLQLWSKQRGKLHEVGDLEHALKRQKATEVASRRDRP